MPESTQREVLQDFLERRLAVEVVDRAAELPAALTESLRRLTDLVPCESASLHLELPAGPAGRRALACVATAGARGDERVGAVAEPSDTPLWEALETGRMARRPFDGDGSRPLHRICVPVTLGRETCGACQVIAPLKLSARHLAVLSLAVDGISARLEHAIDNLRAREIYQRDGLTGLFNDRSLHSSLSELIRDSRRERRDLAILFIDLDFFKRVNDTHGHLAGSQVLREMGDLLERAAEPLDAVAARYGGDEFVVAAPALELDAAIELAEGIRLDVLGSTFCSQPSDLQPDALSLTGLTCSIGIATLSQHGSAELDVERCKSRLLRLSDAAMYVAKETGRNRTAVAGTVVESERRRSPLGLRRASTD